MRLVHIIILLLIPFLLPAQQGTWRWDIKVGIDTAALRLHKKKYKPEPETVQNLASKTNNPKPSNQERSGGKRADAEKRKVTITGYVTETGLEADGDYHLVIKALSGSKTLIAEIPDNDTPKISGYPTYKREYKKARNEVEDKIGTPPSRITKLETKRKVKITGFVFFDKTAHGNGHATNDVEIHPVLEIKVLD